MNRFLFASVCVCLLAVNSLHAESPHTPQAGTSERAAIMDAMRMRAEKDLGQPVVFKVEVLRVVGDWAYARVSPTTPGGDEIDFSKTKYREQVELGAFDPQGEALLRLKGDGWKVLEWAFGGTDVASAAWGEKHDFPENLLP